MRDYWPFALSVAASSGEVEEREKYRMLAFDWAALHSGRTEKLPTEGEEVYESSAVRFSSDVMRKSIEQTAQKKFLKKSSKWGLEHYRVIKAKIVWA